MATTPLEIVLQAPTAGAPARARSHLANVNQASPAPDIRIVVNAEQVAAALDNPHAIADRFALVCANTLPKLGLQAPTPSTLLDQSAVLALAQMRAGGWRYIRA